MGFFPRKSKDAQRENEPDGDFWIYLQEGEVCHREAYYIGHLSSYNVLQQIEDEGEERNLESGRIPKETPAWARNTAEDECVFTN